MAVAKRDPWLDIGEPVDAQQPDQQAMGTGAPAAAPAPAPAVSPANDQFAAIGEPVDPNAPAEVVDNSQTIGGFADELPHEAASKMSPEEEAELVRILSTEDPSTAASHARQFVASRGHTGGGDNFDEIIAGRLKGHKIGSSLIYKIPEGEQSGQPLGAGPAAVRGAAGIISPINTIDSALNAVKDTVTDGGSLEDNFHKWEDINYGILQNDEANHPTARLVGQLLGGLAIPSGAHGRALAAGTDVLRAGGSMREARAAAAVAARNTVAAEGATIGANEGFDSAAPGQGLEGAATGAAIGGAGGAVIGATGQVLAPRLAAKAAATRAAPLTEEQELIRAADRQGVEVIPADVGGPVTRRATSTVTQTIAGGKPVIDASKRMNEQAKTARDRVAEAIGTALEPEAAGQQSISGAKTTIRTSADDARVFYSAAEKASGAVRLDAPKAVAALDRNISELADTPGGAPGLSTLQSLRDSLAKGNLSVTGIRRMRSVIRDQFMQQGLTGSDLERRVGLVLDAAAEDVTDGLSAKGMKGAADLFAKGDAAWRQRAKLVDEVIEPIIGKDGNKSGEQVMRTLTADLQGNNARAIRFLNALPDTERNNVRASLIGAMGKAKAGQQGSEGTDFSLNVFLTHWNQIGDRAKNAFFGPEAKAALNDLAKVAEGTREAQGYRNMSNTGGVVGNLLTLFSGAGGVVTFGKVVGTQYALGKLLASPRFARWLARAPKANSPKAYAAKLGSIARAEPAIASDVLSLQQRLTEAFGTAPMKAAASDNSGNEQTPQ